jgi:hypothetical protein
MPNAIAINTALSEQFPKENRVVQWREDEELPMPACVYMSYGHMCDALQRDVNAGNCSHLLRKLLQQHLEHLLAECVIHKLVRLIHRSQLCGHGTHHIKRGNAKCLGPYMLEVRVARSYRAIIEFPHG